METVLLLATLVVVNVGITMMNLKMYSEIMKIREMTGRK